MTSTTERTSGRMYRTVWRWHFYAGLFSIPFIVWLSLTGAVYLFKPQIERWLDRADDRLHLTGATATPEAQAIAAVAAVPGSSLHRYQLAETREQATRIVVGKGTEEYRVTLHPQTLQVLRVENEDHRPMRVVLHLHGELMAGDWGSRIVELAASWAIVLVLTGLYLWWPRHTETLAGVLYVRWRKGKRILWRDLHAVTGVWISAFALFLLLTGLPWAAGWGSYLKAVRSLRTRHVVRQDWTTGRASELENRIAMNGDSMDGMSMGQAEHLSHAMAGSDSPHRYAPLDRLVPAVAALHLAPPVFVVPPMAPATHWTAKSEAQNRPLRAAVTLDPTTGAIVGRENFDGRPWIDRAVGIGVAAHEGQLFGPLNQLLGLLTAIGLLLLSGSAVVLWWRRRAVGVLGAPVPAGRPRWSWSLIASLLLLGAVLPMFGASLLVVLLLERVLLRRIPAARQWLGLYPA